VLCQRGPYRVERLRLLFVDVVVASDDRSDDRRVPAKGLLKRLPRPDRAGDDLHRQVGFLLSTQTAEELVYEVNDTHW
jgi:hypothetical protein